MFRAPTLILEALLCATLLAFAHVAQGGEVRVAVASNFTAPMKALAAEFSRQTGHSTQLAFASSGKLYAQVVHGAPFQVFLSADEDKPALLQRDGLAVPSSAFTYAVGRLALWSPRPGRVDGEGKVLGEGEFKHLALGNPKLAPYGAAAVDVLDSLGLTSRLRPKWVMGENIAQTWQFVASGNAELGFVALSQVMRDGRIDRGSAWIVPASLHRPIRQDAVLLKAGEKDAAALALMAFLKSPRAGEIIRAHGYEVAAAQQAK